MKRINPEFVKAISHYMNNCPYWSLISMKLKALEWGYSELIIEVSEKHLQPMGIVHGGVYASLVDSTSYWSAFSQLDEGMGLTTVEMKLNYLSPISEGLLLGKGRCLKLGKQIALAEAHIFDPGGLLVCYGTTTMMIIERIDRKGLKDLPPKFL
jgi:uncharacterized protein (TIGR00369 family)